MRAVIKNFKNMTCFSNKGIKMKIRRHLNLAAITIIIVLLINQAFANTLGNAACGFTYDIENEIETVTTSDGKISNYVYNPQSTIKITVYADHKFKRETWQLYNATETIAQYTNQYYVVSDDPTYEHQKSVTFTYNTESLAPENDYMIKAELTDNGGWWGSAYTKTCYFPIRIKDEPLEFSFPEEFQLDNNVYTAKIIEGEQIPEPITITDDYGVYSIIITDVNFALICSQTYPTIGTTSVEINLNKIGESLPNCSTSQKTIKEKIDNGKSLRISASAYYSKDYFITKEIKILKYKKPTLTYGNIKSRQGNVATAYFRPINFDTNEKYKNFKNYYLLSFEKGEIGAPLFYIVKYLDENNNYNIFFNYFYYSEEYASGELIEHTITGSC